MEPPPTYVAGLLLAAIGVLATVVAKLYFENKEKDAARLADAKEYTRTLLDLQERIRESEGEELHRLRKTVDSLVEPEDPPSRPGALARRRPR